MGNHGDTDSERLTIETTPTIGRVRVVIGLVQGIVAWLLLRLVAPADYLPGNHPRAAYWSEQHPMVFAGLALIAAYAPVIAMSVSPLWQRHLWHNALAQLTRSADADVRSRAARMEMAKVRRYYSPGESYAAATEPPLSHATIYPSGATLPADFKSSDWSSEPGFNLNCLQNGGTCDIYVVPYGSDGNTAVIVRETGTREGYYANSSGLVYQRDSAVKWVNTGSFNHMDCPGVVSALRNGQLSAARPEHDDLMVNGVRLAFAAIYRGNDKCEAAPHSEPRPNRSQDAAAPSHIGPAFGRP